MPRLLLAGLVLGLSLPSLACGGNGGPELDYVGSYELESVEGTSLPVAIILSYTSGEKDTTVINGGTLTLRSDGSFTFSDTWLYFGFGEQESGSSSCSGEYGVEADGDFSTDGAIDCNDDTEIERAYGTWSGDQLELNLVFADLGVLSAVFSR
jgi:hypothetical protein